MTFVGDTGEISATWRPGSDVETLRLRSTTARLVAPGSVTNGQFGLFRWDMTSGAGGSGAHFHKTFSESFYVIDGTVSLFNGDKWMDATPGDFLYVPEGGIHAFHNASEDKASMLILFSPGPPRERYFQALAEIAESGRTLSEEEWAEHDQYPA